MKTILRITVLMASVCQVALLFAEDSLFSEVAMESVFEKNATLSTVVATLGDGETLERITGVTSLTLALKYAGFTPKEKANKVAIHVDLAGWKFPANLEVQIEQDRIYVEMSLIELTDASTVDSKELLKLLEKNDAVAGYVFAYDSNAKLIQLRSSFENRAITAKKLKANLVQLASFAEKHAELWSKLKAKTSAKSTEPVKQVAGSSVSKPITTTPAAPSASTGLSLFGTWGAALKGGDSIALQIKEDLSFKLVTVKSGKSTVSNGKYTRTGNRLTLSGDDKVTLNCTVSQTVSNKFQLAIIDDKGAAKLTVDFQKSK